MLKLTVEKCGFAGHVDLLDPISVILTWCKDGKFQHRQIRFHIIITWPVALIQEVGKDDGATVHGDDDEQDRKSEV